MKHVLLVILMLAAQWCKADVIRVGTDPWCPYNCEDKTNEGISIDILRKVFEPLGHKVEVYFVPWARAISGMRSGEFTNFTSAAKADCPECLYAEIPTTYMQNTFFVKKDSTWKWSDLKSLEHMHLGVIKGYTYGEDLTKYIEQNKVNSRRITETFGNDALLQLINMLAANRLSLIIDDVNVITYQANRLGKGNQIRKVEKISSIPLYFGFSPKNPKSNEYAAIMTKNLRNMINNGELRAIYKKYGVDCLVCTPGP